MKPLQPLRSIIYEANGTGSFSRTAGMLDRSVGLGMGDVPRDRQQGNPRPEQRRDIHSEHGRVVLRDQSGDSHLQPKDKPTEPQPHERQQGHHVQ